METAMKSQYSLQFNNNRVLSHQICDPNIKNYFAKKYVK